jgi:N-acetylglucosamine-6-phosphate deacetylase
MRTKLCGLRLLDGDQEVEYPVVSIEDGHITSIDTDRANASADILTPCFFDIHVHGARSYDFMTAGTEGVSVVGGFLASRGVGHYLPTTVTGPLDATLRALERLADAIEVPPQATAAIPVGIHLEGPFVSHAKRGVHPPEYLLQPSTSIFDRMQQAARGHIRLMTVAPELASASELIEHATKSGVRVSLGHSDANAAEALAGIKAGAVSATHTFNAMRTLGHREPGIAGVVLDNEELYAEAICDGVHVDPLMIRLWLRMKGAERGILITDGMAATGEGDGDYLLGDLPVEVRHGVCMLRGTDTLAGSVLTMDRAVQNLRRFTGSSLGVAVRLASRNPARMLGMEPVVRLSVGNKANFNVYDEAGKRKGTMIRGRMIGEADSD